ncbi:MAG TPA: hypothetical protein VFW09_08565 [Solirubrobacteraceae bacterium]|nr:hypothetical protein [Solirubrobacteraceae bacterium]
MATMRAEHGWQILVAVTVRTMHIAIDVGIDGEQISGRAGDGAGPPKQFTGWLGLIGVLDGLLSSSGSGTTAPGARLCLGFATAEDASAFAASAAMREVMDETGACGAPEIWVSHDRTGGQ